MHTRSSSNLPIVSPPNPSTSNPKRRNRRRSKQPSILEESPIDTMADQRTMVELLRAPTEGYVEAIVVPPILAEQFELKHSLINMMTSNQFFGLEKDNPHDHIRWDNIQGYVAAAAVSYNQGNSVYRPPEGCNVLPEKLLDLDSTKDLHPPLHVNSLSGGTTYSSSPNPLLEELVDELNLINLANPTDNFVDSMPEMFTDEHALDYSSPPIFDEYDDDFLEVDSDAKNVYDYPFDSKGEKIKESKLLIDELDLLCDFLPPSKYDSFISENFSRVDALPSTNNEDKVFNPGRENQESKLLIDELDLPCDFLLPYEYDSFLSKDFSKVDAFPSTNNEDKVFNSGGKDTHILDVPCPHFYPIDQYKYGGIGSS
nr:reverse transcriptase domain-containing protein [Tanacetum cinerariifolium]